MASHNISGGVKRMNSNESNSQNEHSSRLMHSDFAGNYSSNENDVNNDDESPLLASKKGEADSISNGKVNVTRMLSSGSSGTVNRTQTPNEMSSLFTMRAMIYIVLWYFFSFTTLFLNKYIVSYEKGDATMLGKLTIIGKQCYACWAMTDFQTAIASQFANFNALKFVYHFDCER